MAGEILSDKSEPSVVVMLLRTEILVEALWLNESDNRKLSRCSFLGGSRGLQNDFYYCGGAGFFKTGLSPEAGAAMVAAVDGFGFMSVAGADTETPPSV